MTPRLLFPFSPGESRALLRVEKKIWRHSRLRFLAVAVTVGVILAAVPPMAESPPAASVAEPVSAVWMLDWAKAGEMRRVDGLVLALNDEDPILRQAAGAALRTLTGEMFAADAKRWSEWWQSVKLPAEPTSELMGRLGDPRDEVRRQAFWKLAHKDDEQAARALIERWINRKDGHPKGENVYSSEDVYNRDTPLLRRAVVMLGDRAIDMLIPLAASDSGIGENALQILAGCDSAKVTASVAKILASGGPSSQVAALVLAGKYRSLSNVPALIQTLEVTNASRPPQAAFESLVQYDSQAIPLYRKALADESLNLYARGAVAVLLANLDDKSGWDMLEKIVADGSAYEMNTIIGNTGKTRNEVFWPLIEKALQRPDAWQSLTYDARDCGGIKAIPALERIAKEHPNEGTRYGAEIQLRVLRQPHDDRENPAESKRLKENEEIERKRTLQKLEELARYEETGGTPAAGGQPVEDAKTIVWSGELVLEKEHVVPVGCVLKIEAGTTIHMQEYGAAKITVKGALIAVGTGDKPIRFLARKSGGYWSGITFEAGSSGGRLEHCQFLNARRHAIMIKGGSLIIAHCAFTFDQYTDGFIFCRRGAGAVIEGNTFAWKEHRGKAGVVCESSPAVIRRNDFGNARVGVQLFGFKPGAPKATIEGNNFQSCVVGVFDEETTGSAKWEEAWRSEMIVRPDKIAVSRTGKSDSVTICPYRIREEDSGRIDMYVVSYDAGRFSIKSVRDTKPKDFTDFKANVATGFTMDDGTQVRIEMFVSGLSMIGEDGCMDTPAAYAALVADSPEGAQVIWRAAKFQRGMLNYTAADLDGDGVFELVVTTGRFCEGKGQVFIYKQNANRAAPTGVSVPSTNRAEAARGKYGSLAVKVLDRNGAPPVGGNVLVGISIPGDEKSAKNADIDAQGRARFEELRPGTYLVFSCAPPKQNKGTQEDCTIPFFGPETIEATADKESSVTLRPKYSTAAIVEVLPPVDSPDRPSGKLLLWSEARAGAPLPETGPIPQDLARKGLITHYIYMKSGHSYRFENLAPGVYWVFLDGECTGRTDGEAWKHNYIGKQRFELQEGKTSQVSLRPELTETHNSD